jgi:peroxiredoxin
VRPGAARGVLGRCRRTARPVVAVVALVAAGCGSDPQAGRGPLRPGDAAPRWVGTTLAGDSIDLAGLHGRVVLVNVWATWCVPCREEMPALDALYRARRPDGLEVVGVSIDGPTAGRAVERFVADHGIGFVVAHDPQARITRAFRTVGVPETFLIDARGRIAHRWLGPFDPLNAETAAFLAAVGLGDRARSDPGPGAGHRGHPIRR